LAGGAEQDLGDERCAAEAEQVGPEPAWPVQQVEGGERLELAAGAEMDGGVAAGEGFEDGAEPATWAARALGEDGLYAVFRREQSEDAAGLAVVEGAQHDGLGDDRGHGSVEAAWLRWLGPGQAKQLAAAAGRSGDAERDPGEAGEERREH